MRKTVIGLAGIVLAAAIVRAEDAKFAADNLKYSREFYSKAHFIAVADAPEAFKYDRYPSGGPERIQCDAGTYLRQRGKPWVHIAQNLRSGLPINYAEHDRYVMTFALKDDWGRSGDPVDDQTSRKLDGWIKLVDAAFSVGTADLKPAEKSEAEGRVQWTFEAPSKDVNGVPIRLTFRKLVSDNSDDVLLHEFSGPLRLEGDKVVPGSATDVVRLGFGYMMRVPQQEYEVSEAAWEEMQAAHEKKDASSGNQSGKSSPTIPGRHPAGHGRKQSSSKEQP
jgi:hypothetical protein